MTPDPASVIATFAEMDALITATFPENVHRKIALELLGRALRALLSSAVAVEPGAS